MMSLAAIRAASRRAATQAAERGLVPLLVEAEDKQSGDRLARHLRGVPFIGTHRPQGWRLVKRYFVDSSGMGERDEPALTYVQFLRQMKVGRGYAIVEAGQFQVYVGEFKPIERRQ